MEELTKSEEKDRQENTNNDFFEEQYGKTRYGKTIINQIVRGIYDNWDSSILEYDYKSEN
jgi:hypothetical protein